MSVTRKIHFCKASKAAADTLTQRYFLVEAIHTLYGLWSRLGWVLEEAGASFGGFERQKGQREPMNGGENFGGNIVAERTWRELTRLLRDQLEDECEDVSFKRVVSRGSGWDWGRRVRKGEMRVFWPRGFG